MDLETRGDSVELHRSNIGFTNLQMAGTEMSRWP